MKQYGDYLTFFCDPDYWVSQRRRIGWMIMFHITCHYTHMTKRATLLEVDTWWTREHMIHSMVRPNHLYYLVLYESHEIPPFVILIQYDTHQIHYFSTIICFTMIDVAVNSIGLCLEGEKPSYKWCKVIRTRMILVDFNKGCLDNLTQAWHRTGREWVVMITFDFLQINALIVSYIIRQYVLQLGKGF
jgi:hypothetical protein